MQLQQQHCKIPHHACAGQVAIEVDQDVCAHVVEHLRRIEVRDVRNVDEAVYQVQDEDEVGVNDLRSSGKGESMRIYARYAAIRMGKHQDANIHILTRILSHTHTHTLSLPEPAPTPTLPRQQHDDDAPLP